MHHQREERLSIDISQARVSLASDKQILSARDHLIRTSLIISDKVKFQEWQFNCHIGFTIHKSYGLYDIMEPPSYGVLELIWR